MLAAGFVSYVGAFDAQNRNALWLEQWYPDLLAKGIPITEGIQPLDLLTSSAKTAQMVSEGLPADPISTENGAIITSCKRWPLIIDPQVQGIKWLRDKETPHGLQVSRESQFHASNWQIQNQAINE